MPETLEQVNQPTASSADFSAQLHDLSSGRVSGPANHKYLPQLIKVGIPVVLADALAISLGLSLGLIIVLLYGKEVNHFDAFALLAISAYGLTFWAAGLYPGIGMHPAQELRQLFRGALCATLALMTGLLCVSSYSSPYVWILAAAYLVMPVSIPAFRGLMKYLMQSIDLGVPIYFLGRREDVRRVYADMSRFGWTRLRPIGRFSYPNEHDDLTVEAGTDDDYELQFERRVPYCGTPDVLPRLAAENQVFWLFVVGDATPTMRLIGSFPEVVWIRSQKSYFCSGKSIMNYGLANGIRIEEALLLPLPRFQKRVQDVLISGLALVFLLPLLLLIAVLVKLTSRGPVFFRHRRIGSGGRQFHAWKFRSMVSNADEVLARYLADHPGLKKEWDKDHKLKHDPRATWIGRVLRKTSLDEVPQLWNVLVGDMSLVGPRPIVAAEIEKYGKTFRDYLRVRPGITGLWQVSGRNNTTYSERLAYDEFYVQHWSPWLDVYILMRTVRTVILCEGAY